MILIQYSILSFHSCSKFFSIFEFDLLDGGGRDLLFLQLLGFFVVAVDEIEPKLVLAVMMMAVVLADNREPAFDVFFLAFADFQLLRFDFVDGASPSHHV